jgi:DNA-binding FrmR family transcriptional regulator
MRGYTQDKDAYVKRLRRIEGQVRGLQRMVEEDTYCVITETLRLSKTANFTGSWSTGG